MKIVFSILIQQTVSVALKSCTTPFTPLASKFTQTSEGEDNESLANQFDEKRKTAGEYVEKFKFNMKRVKFLTGNEGYLHREAKGVAYYLHRDQRLQDNWAALYAQKLALADNLPLYVIAGISG